MVPAPLLMYIFLSYANAETILCDGGQTTNDCKAQTISCTANESCTIRCKLHRSNATDYAVCHNSIINCAPTQDCLVECDAGIEACRGITINAHNATRLDIISKTDRAYNDANIYCPLRAPCSFASIPLHTQRAFAGLTILSTTGFNDNTIRFECASSNCFNGVRMNCTTDYSRSCFISQLHDPCNADSVCGAPLPNSIYNTRSSAGCKGWEITFTFTLLSAYDTDELQTIFTNAFIETILAETNNNTWNDEEWCYRIDDAQLNNLTFIVNNALYSDALTANRTMKRFVDQFEPYLIANITDFELHPPVYSYSKYDIPLQTEGPHDDKEIVITISIVIVIAACVLGSMYTIHKCWAFEKTVDEKTDPKEKKEGNDGATESEKKETTSAQTCTHKNAESLIVYTLNNAAEDDANDDADAPKQNNIDATEKDLNPAIEMPPPEPVKKIFSHSASDTASKDDEVMAEEYVNATESEDQTLTPLKKMDTNQQEQELKEIFETIMADNDHIATPQSEESYEL